MCGIASTGLYYYTEKNLDEKYYFIIEKIDFQFFEIRNFEHFEIVLPGTGSVLLGKPY